MIKTKPFDNPIYVTKPMLPSLDSYNKKLLEVWESGILSNMGKQHNLLEDELKKVLKVPNLSLFNNGTNALITAIQSLRISGECITTPFTFAATPHVLSWNNVRPIFCDIDPTTMCIDAEKIERCITPKTTAILAVHVFGHCCDVEKIQDIANYYGLKVIYDGAHAFQTEINGIGIGNFGDITMFSFHPTKLFHTGEGGALTYKDQNLKKRIDLLKNFGIKNENEVVMPGINGKMSEIQASLGLVNLEILEEERSKRAEILKIYKEKLSKIEDVSWYSLPENIQNSLQYFVIRVKSRKTYRCTRDELQRRLKEYNVVTRKYFYPLCSDYTCYKHLESSKRLPFANLVSSEVLCLPFYGELGVENATKICDLIGGIMKEEQENL